MSENLGTLQYDYYSHDTGSSATRTQIIEVYSCLYTVFSETFSVSSGETS